MIRLFAGLQLPETIKRQLIFCQGGVDGARWLREDQLHLTLRFIGEVAPDRAEDVRHALDRVAFDPFSIEIAGMDCFGPKRAPRMLWAGVRDGRPLKHLYDKIERSLIEIGLEPERRKFHPHITLARLKGRPRRLQSYLVSHADLALPAFRVDQFVLFQSHLGQDGARYEVVAEYAARDFDAQRRVMAGR